MLSVLTFLLMMLQSHFCLSGRRFRETSIVGIIVMITDEEDTSLLAPNNELFGECIKENSKINQRPLLVERTPTHTWQEYFERCWTEVLVTAAACGLMAFFTIWFRKRVGKCNNFELISKDASFVDIEKCDSISRGNHPQGSTNTSHDDASRNMSESLLQARSSPTYVMDAVFFTSETKRKLEDEPNASSEKTVVSLPRGNKRERQGETTVSIDLTTDKSHLAKLDTGLPSSSDILFPKEFRNCTATRSLHSDSCLEQANDVIVHNADHLGSSSGNTSLTTTHHHQLSSSHPLIKIRIESLQTEPEEGHEQTPLITSPKEYVRSRNSIDDNVAVLEKMETKSTTSPVVKSSESSEGCSTDTAEIDHSCLSPKYLKHSKSIPQPELRFIDYITTGQSCNMATRVDPAVPLTEFSELHNNLFPYTSTSQFEGNLQTHFPHENPLTSFSCSPTLPISSPSSSSEQRKTRLQAEKGVPVVACLSKRLLDHQVKDQMTSRSDAQANPSVFKSPMYVKSPCSAIPRLSPIKEQSSISTESGSFAEEAKFDGGDRSSLLSSIENQDLNPRYYEYD